MSLNRSCFKEASRSRLYSTQSGEMLVGPKYVGSRCRWVRLRRAGDGGVPLSPREPRDGRGQGRGAQRGLEGGRMPFCEPGLGELLAKIAGRLRFGTTPDGAVHEAGAIFVCVAPQGKDGSADLSSVAAVAGSRGRGRWRKGRGRTENARFWWPTRARSRWEARPGPELRPPSA